MQDAFFYLFAALTLLCGALVVWNPFSRKPAIDAMVSTRNIALVTGLRLNGFHTTRTPQSSVSAAKR